MGAAKSLFDRNREIHEKTRFRKQSELERLMIQENIS